MKQPSVSGVVERRLLVNYRVDPEVAARVLPPPLRPQLVAGWAVAGICLIRLGQLRPSRVPARLGIRSENAAHRVAVEWDCAEGPPKTGVYIPRRDSASLVNVIAGGRLFPGEHHRAAFDVHETARDLHVAFDSVDGTAHISLDARVTQRLEGSLLFTDVQQASDFFRHSSAGFSPARDGRKLDGMELHADRWAVEPVEVLAVRSSFFEDTRLFPTGSATLDCALLMRDIPMTWTALLPMLASAALFAVSGATRLRLAPHAT
ncbi:MAG TPA: DUF2071 domain-containing protein [Trebonia sp.]|jgi:hypothetical protein|nr:DUF2071 domain-containing protein [Trebonia sp.]